MKVVGAGAFALALAGGSPALQAQTADLTRATCAELMGLPQNERGQLIVWLHGYYAGAAQRAMLDRPKLEEAFAAFHQVCERNRVLPLIGSEARSVFLGEAPAPTQPPSPTAPAPRRPGGQASPIPAR